MRANREGTHVGGYFSLGWDERANPQHKPGGTTVSDIRVGVRAKREPQSTC